MKFLSNQRSRVVLRQNNAIFFTNNLVYLDVDWFLPFTTTLLNLILCYPLFNLNDSSVERPHIEK